MIQRSSDLDVDVQIQGSDILVIHVPVTDDRDAALGGWLFLGVRRSNAALRGIGFRRSVGSICRRARPAAIAAIEEVILLRDKEILLVDVVMSLGPGLDARKRVGHSFTAGDGSSGPAASLPLLDLRATDVLGIELLVAKVDLSKSLFWSLFLLPRLVESSSKGKLRRTNLRDLGLYLGNFILITRSDSLLELPLELDPLEEQCLGVERTLLSQLLVQFLLGELVIKQPVDIGNLGSEHRLRWHFALFDGHSLAVAIELSLPTSVPCSQVAEFAADKPQ